jgi:hypothetical protein
METVLVLDDPVAAAVLADEEERRLRVTIWGRLVVNHLHVSILLQDHLRAAIARVGTRPAAEAVNWRPAGFVKMLRCAADLRT